jgi:hypothetical protein
MLPFLFCFILCGLFLQWRLRSSPALKIYLHYPPANVPSCCIVIMMRPLPALLLTVCLLFVVAPVPSLAAQASAKSQQAVSDISGMYSFVREGEFIQLTDDDGKLSGYISRFDSDTDKDQIVDQFFDKASLQGDRLTFTTKVIHGIWFDFNGTISISSGKKPPDEGYRVIKGTLIQHETDVKGVEKTMQRQADFKSFPADLSRP